MISRIRNDEYLRGDVKQLYGNGRRAERLPENEVDDKILHEDEDDVEMEDKIDDAELADSPDRDEDSSKDDEMETDGDFGDKDLQ